MLHVVLQTGVAAAEAIGPVGQTTVVGGIVVSLLTLMGWLVKRLLDNLVNQNTTLMTQQLSKMDEAIKAIGGIREEIREGFHDLGNAMARTPTPTPIRREESRGSSLPPRRG